MKIPTPKHSVTAVALGLLFSLASLERAPGQTACCLVFPPAPDNGAIFGLTTPWALTGDYTVASNPAYFSIQVTTGDVVVPAGTYRAWCVDAATPIDPGPTTYTNLLYSTCDTNLNSDLPAGRPATVYVSPDVWHQVNYLLNHKTVSGTNAYFWDVQLAIWGLVGGPVPSVYLDPSQGYPPADTNVENLLVADAQANAAAWQLPCGGTIGVVAVVQDWSSAVQLLMLEVPCSCNTPTIVPTGGTVGQTFISPPTVLGGTNYTITSGSLPPGLVLNPTTGDITGTPTTPGTYTFTETVTDSTGTTTTLPPTTIIIAPPLAGVFVSEEIACLQPTNNCAPFAKLAAGIKGLEDPGFCYQITVTNSGVSGLTNLSVVDSHLGDVTTNLFAAPTVVLPPGGVATAYFKAAWATNTTNTVTVSGQSVTNGATVTASDGTVALVDLASLTCNVMVTAPCDLDGVPNNNHVLLPGCGASCSVQFDVQVCNTGQADLTAVVLSSPALAALGCGLPAPFTLPVGSCSNFQCSATLTCPGQALPVNVTVAAKASAGAGACAYDLSSTNIVDVAAAGSGLVECAAGSANVCGAVLRDCAANGNLAGAPGLAGVVVTLKNTSGYAVAATVTDPNGAWCFNQEPDGVYTVVVTPPANYLQTVDPDATLDNQTVVTVTGCANLTGVNFGYTGSAPAVTLIKTGPAAANCGDTITYTFAVTNTGNTCFSGLQVIDPMFGGEIFNAGAVVPGQGFVFTTNYVVKATDPTNLVNTATAVGHPPTGNAVTAPASWTVQVTPCVPLTLACATGAGVSGTPFSAAPQANGGVPPYLFAMVAGSLPPGLTLDPATGAITGTPTSAGTFGFALQVTDAKGATAVAGCTQGCFVTNAWNFSTLAGVLGTSQAYTTNGLTITAYGYAKSGQALALYGKTQGGDENGVGIACASDYEIGTSNFIQLDLTQVIASGAQNALLVIGSVQPGEGYNIYGSTTQGVLGTLLGSNGTLDFTPFPVPGYPAYPFVSVSASAANVLLDALSVVVPSPTCVITIAAPAPPPPPCVGVDKEIACAQPNNACGPLGKSAAGFKGVEAPGFCYQITVTNCGPVALTNLTVVDDLLGDVTTNFFPTPATALPPGGTATANFRLASEEDTTSTVTVSAQSAADGTPASATDHVLAQVTAATIACQTFVTAPDDVDGHINSNVVMLPNDGAPHLVTFSLTVTNPGAADLASVTIVAPTLTNLSGALPGPFALPAGTALNFTLGSTALTCPNFPVNNPVSVVGLIDTSKSGGCANDVDGNAIVVQSQCSAQVGCTNVSHGCTFTIGYYKNHPSAIGPLPIDLGTNGGVDTLIVTNQPMGADVESQKVFGAPSNGITKLYAQLLAAKISILHGADSSAVATTITQADAFLSAYNYLDWSNLSGAQQQSVLQWQTTLDSYNNGYIGPGHCSAPCQPRQQSIESQFNSQMPRGSSCVWFNAHVSAQPGQEATIYCKNASVKIVGRSGQKYTYPVPDGTIVFSASATNATTTFDGTQWTTTVPTAGDDEIFMAGLSVPMLSDFARAGSVTWQCDFTSDMAGLNLNWQWSASAYGTDLSQYGSLGVKASHNNACSTGAGFKSSDHAGTPGTVKGFLAPGCRGGGGSNYTGSWSGKDSLQLCNQSNDASDGD